MQMRHDIDLIIVGSRGLTEFRPFLLGSVSRRVVMHAPCSVLVVKKPLNGLNRIVVATDGSKDARGAVEFLLRLPLSKEVTVTLVSVVPPLPIETGHESESLAGVLEQVREPLEAEARAVAARAAQRVREAGFQAAVVVSHGHIGHRIVELAESTQADLVVVGSRGLTGMTRYLMGSVSDAVVKYAACPVLVFRR
jgi:nucleotide-binding universal stress UspA family protein